MLNFDRSIL